MEFQIIDIDYVMVNDKPVIRIYGRNTEGESVCCFYENFLSYFYCGGEGIEDVFRDEPNVIRIEKVKKKPSIGYHNEKEFYKIITNNPAKTPDMREMALKAGLEVFEADIPFKYRFMADFNLNGLDWVRAEGMVGVNTETVATQKTFSAKKLVKIDRVANAKIKTLSVDIECIPMEAGAIPQGTKDPIIMIGCVFDPPHRGETTRVLATRNDKGVTYSETEKDMLTSLINLIYEYDPDIITGFNINNFDLPYILDRMRNHNIKPVFGRCKQKQVTANKIAMRYKINLTGRFIADSYEIVKKDFSLKRYSLNNVSQELLGKKKEDVKHSEIERLWKGSQEDFRRLVKYCEIDAVLAMELLNKLNVLEKYFALAKVSGTLMQDVLNSGEATRIENFLLREFNREGFIFPIKPSGHQIQAREQRKKAELAGGFVIDPDKGLHSNVLVLDFKSMYPSIIITYNLCPTTFASDFSLVKQEDCIKTPTGSHFVKKEVREGIVPRIVGELLRRRGEAKKKVRDEEDPYLKQAYDAEQWALKILANAFYGYLGYHRAKIYELAVANSITSFGREIIGKTKTIIERDYEYRVVYGDTDSVFVKVPETDMTKINDIGLAMVKHINKFMDGVMILEFEKLFRRFLPLTKKRYAAWAFFPEMVDGTLTWKEKTVMKGIETVRRDWCPLVGETLNVVLDSLLKKEDVKGALKFSKTVIRDLIDGKISLDKLVITKTMTKGVKGYKGIQPHIELVKKLRARGGEVPGIGDRVGYVIIKGTQLLSKRAEDPGYVTEKGLQIDPQYYIDNQLMPPLERIFSGLGVEKSELMGTGKQMGIFDMLKKEVKKEILEKLPADEMNGVVCQKCEKYYEKPPLVGVCECGGQFLFSSKKGAFKVAVVKK